MIVTHLVESPLPPRRRPIAALIGVLSPASRENRAGRRDAGPLDRRVRIVVPGLRDCYCAAAASVMAWQTFSGVEAPRKRATVASLIAVPMAGEVAWSR